MSEYYKNCYELAKHLFSKTQGYEEIIRDNLTLFNKAMKTRKENVELQVKLDQLKIENDELKEKVKELRQGWINCNKERNIQEANSEFRQRVIDSYEQKLKKIEEYCNEQNLKADYTACDILQIIDEVE